MYYVILEDRDETHAFLSDRPPTIKPWFFRLTKGITLESGWPSEVVFKFASTRPDGLQQTDYHANSFRLLVVSPDLKVALQEFDLTSIEYLPIQIHNHKGRVASTDYHIANLFPLVSAVDRERSDFEPDPLRPPDGIFNFKTLVLKEDSDQPLPLLFRLEEQPMMVLCHESIVDRIRELELTGMRFVATSYFKTFET